MVLSMALTTAPRNLWWCGGRCPQQSFSSSGLLVLLMAGSPPQHEDSLALSLFLQLLLSVSQYFFMLIYTSFIESQNGV